MKNSFILLLLHFVCSHLTGQTITQAEYFLDTDAGFGRNNLVNVTPANDGTFPLSINVNDATVGYHKLYIRTKNSEGIWSQTARKTIEIVKSADRNIITSGEYFFDADPGFGKAGVISVQQPDSIIMQQFSAAVNALPLGYHKLYGRLMDNYSNWSQTFRRTIEIVKDTTGGRVMMVEYFFNTDAGFGNCTSVTFATPAKDSSFVFTIPQSQIPANYSSFYYRVKDDVNQNWSLTNPTTQKVLPLILLDFTTVKSDKNALLNWKTTNEINTDFFNIQRSIDAANFVTIGKVKAKGKQASVNTYNFSDNVSKIQAGKVYYRLAQTDKDGTVSFSKITSIEITGGNLITILPNPATNYFTITTKESIELENATLLINSAAGQMVIQQKLSNSSTQKINISSLTSGMYVVKIVTSRKVFTQKLMVK